MAVLSCRLELGKLPSSPASRIPRTVSEHLRVESLSMAPDAPPPSSGCYGYFCAPCMYADTSAIMGTGGWTTECLTIFCCGPLAVCFCAPGRRDNLRASLGGLPVTLRLCTDCVGLRIPSLQTNHWSCVIARSPRRSSMFRSLHRRSHAATAWCGCAVLPVPTVRNPASSRCEPPQSPHAR